nr:PREDICTED: interferon lambda-4-like [Rhinolophus sinicus]
MVHTTLDASQGTVEGRPRSSTRHPGHIAGAEMGPNGAAAVAVGLWFSVTVSVAAGPDVAAPRRCILSHYRSLDPRALAAVKALRDRYEEETLSWRPRNCSFRPRRDPPRPSSCARLRLVARGLADAQAVLKSLPSPELFPGVPPTLELLAAAGRDVAACVSICGFGPSTPRGRSARSIPPPGRRILDLAR